MKDIGAVLKNARENKEFTQKQVMELTGINKKSLSGYENNVAEPDLQTFATLINLYGLSADEVLEISTSTPSLLLSKKESSLLSTFNKLDFQHQEETLLLLRTLTRYLTQKKIKNSPYALFRLYGLFFYSVRSAVTGSLLAAFLEGINPPSNVSTTLKRIRTIAGAAGRIALT